MMFELVKKDLGMCKMLLIGGAVAVLLPYIAYGVYGLYEMNSTAMNQKQFWGMGLTTATMFSSVITIFSFPFLGGYIVAGERRERSAEFLAYLPPKRSEILFSKLLVCAGWTVFALTVYLFVSQWLIPTLLEEQTGLRMNWETTPGMFAMFASMFCVAWMLSCIITSPVFSVVGGLCAPVIVLILALCVSVAFEQRIDEMMSPTNMFIIFASISVLSFATGCFSYVRRVEP